MFGATAERETRDWPRLMDIVQFVPAGTEVEFTLQRGDAETRNVKLAPVAAEDAFVAARGFWFKPVERIRKADNIRCNRSATVGRKPPDALTMVFRFLKKIGTQVPISALGGPVTIAKAAGYSAAEGISSLLIFLTMLSANLAVLNFLPIPLLDGGHMVFLAYEGIRGRPANEKFVVALHTAWLRVHRQLDALRAGARFEYHSASNVTKPRICSRGLRSRCFKRPASKRPPTTASSTLAHADATHNDVRSPVVDRRGRHHALLHIGFQHTERLFVPLDRHVQRLQHPLGREVVDDDPLLHIDRFGRHAERLRIQAEVENEFFRRAGDAAEVCVQRDRVLIGDFHTRAAALVVEQVEVDRRLPLRLFDLCRPR